MLYVFLLLIAAVGGVAYLVLVVGQVPGAKEERLGEWEPLPEGLGRWQVDGESPEGRGASAQGLTREVRWLHDPDAGIGGGGKLVRQARYRNAKTSAIERIDADEVVKRRRVKKVA